MAMETQPGNKTTSDTIAGDSVGDTDPCHPCHPATAAPSGRRAGSKQSALDQLHIVPAPAVRSEERDERFFAALENGYPVAEACRAAGYTRQVVYRRRQKDSEFDDRWRSAQAVAADLLEEEADRRGRDGYMDVVYSMGKLTSERRRYSDGLLLARLKALKPELYRERKPAPVNDQRQITIVIRDAEADELMIKLVNENKLSPNDLSPALQARLRESLVLSDQRTD
jgi:hypothetical protein